MARQTLFEGLVYDDRDRPVTTTIIGDDAFYVVDDNGFLRHIDAEQVDRQVVSVFLEQLQQNKDLAVEQALRMLGRDDLFTKAALDASIRNVTIDQIIAQGLPLEARNMMGMVGFRVVINEHGDVTDMQQPYVADDEL